MTNSRFHPGQLVRTKMHTGPNFIRASRTPAPSFQIKDHMIGMVISNETNFKHLYKIMFSDGRITVIPSVSLELL